MPQNIPNERRNEIELARRGLVALPRWKIGQSEPGDFLIGLQISVFEYVKSHTHANLFPRLGLEWVVFRNSRYYVQRDRLLFNRHL